MNPVRDPVIEALMRARPAPDETPRLPDADVLIDLYQAQAATQARSHRRPRLFIASAAIAFLALAVTATLLSQGNAPTHSSGRDGANTSPTKGKPVLLGDVALVARQVVAAERRTQNLVVHIETTTDLGTRIEEWFSPVGKAGQRYTYASFNETGALIEQTYFTLTNRIDVNYTTRQWAKTPWSPPRAGQIPAGEALAFPVQLRRVTANRHFGFSIGPGTRTFDGRPIPYLTRRMPAGGTQELWFDPITFRLLRDIVTGNASQPGSTYNHQDDYRYLEPTPANLRPLLPVIPHGFKHRK